MFLDVTPADLHLPTQSGYSGASIYGVEPKIIAWHPSDRGVILSYRNRTLVDSTPHDLVSKFTGILALTVADLNADGLEEIVTQGTQSPSNQSLIVDRIFEQTPLQGWRNTYSHSHLKLLAPIIANMAVIDRRGTGRYSAFLATSGLPSRFYELGSDGKYGDRAKSLQLDAEYSYSGIWVGPWSSAWSDFILHHQNGRLMVLKNQGDGRFEAHAEFETSKPCGPFAIFDANHDERLDLFLTGIDAANQLLLRSLDGQFRDQTSMALALPQPIRSVLVADFDNDGQEEIFLLEVGHQNWLFRYADQRWRLDEACDAAGAGTQYTSAICADIDADGILELIVTSESQTCPIRIFKSANARGNWLRIVPLTRHSAPARGSMVKLRSHERTQIRIIDAGHGSTGQCEPVAHFGLGEHASVQHVTVIWPDGAKVRVDSPEINRVHQIRYPSG